MIPYHILHQQPRHASLGELVRLEIASLSERNTAVTYLMISDLQHQQDIYDHPQPSPDGLKRKKMYLFPQVGFWKRNHNFWNTVQS